MNSQDAISRSGSPISDREIKWLSIIANGGCRKTAAKELGTSVNAVNEWAQICRAKLGAKTTAHAVYMAARRGLIK